MNKYILGIIALSGSVAQTSWAAESAEEKVALDKLPAPVARALKEHAGAATITNVSKEAEKGKTVYEATFKAKGRVHDLTVDAAGKLVSDEETVPFSEAPGVIRQAIEREFPGAKVEKFERIREGGRTNYEALLSGKNRREEIKFSDKGKVLERENKTGSKEKD